jgi:Phage portal protein, SPP1 Gp6-like.
MPTKKPTVKQLQNQVSMLNDALEAALSLSPEKDNNFFTGGLSGLYEGRNSWDRKKVFAESLRAWRVNPIARRIVKLYTSFTVGKGLTIKSDDKEIETWLQAWWNHPLNKFNRNVKRWKDEEVRTGNLFPLYTVQDDGVSIVRMVPAEQIADIETTENDIEQETGYWKDEGHEEKWDAPSPTSDNKVFMLHYASNQPVGSPWGEADLSPLLVWIGRFSSWLENRVRLNQFRTAFMYVVRGQYDSETARSAREKTLQNNPPKPGSVLVMNSNNGEEWGILSANLDAFDASMDGTAIKKMIMDGAGQPMHWHAEGESAISTTAEAAGTPTFRTLEEMQNDFFEMLINMAQVALKVAGKKTNAKIWIEGPDITERDNATLALALGRAYPQLADMFDRDAINSKEFMRLVYKTFAEVWDDTKTPSIKKKPLVKPSEQPQAVEDTKTDESDPEEGE